jgi:hypothetical protein
MVYGGEQLANSTTPYDLGIFGLKIDLLAYLQLLRISKMKSD